MHFKSNSILKHVFALLLAAMIAMPLATSPGYATASGITQEQETATVTAIENKLDFLFIESTELTAPATQNIAISWDKNVSRADSLELVYTTPDGKTAVMKEKERTDSSVLFSKDFSESETGTYVITGVNYTVGETSGFFKFDDVEITPSFTVIAGSDLPSEAENILLTEQTTSDTNIEVLGEMISDTLDVANVPTLGGDDDKLVIVLDPGHGSNEPGSSGNGIKEHEAVAKIAKYCKEYLDTCEDEKVEVYLTHTGEGFTGTDAERMQARVDYAASVKADILLSLHINAGGGYGAEIWYPNENYIPEAHTTGKALAEEVLEELVKLGLRDRGIKEKSFVTDQYPGESGVMDYYGIIRRSKLAGIPAIIVEHAFIDSANDVENYLSSDKKLKRLAAADVRGIADYFDLEIEIEATELDITIQKIREVESLEITADNWEECKATVEAARAAYDALDDADKREVGSSKELIITKAELTISEFERAAAEAELDHARRALAIGKIAVKNIKVAYNNVNNTQVTLKYTWDKVADADKYLVELYRNGNKISTVRALNPKCTFTKFKRGYNYTVKIRPYVEYGGDTYNGKIVTKNFLSRHGEPTFTVSKSGKYHILKSDNRNSTGYQVCISTDKEFKKNVKKYKFSTNREALNKKVLTANYFKKGKNYIKVRAYTTFNGQTVYSKWSSVKTVTR